jgi:hypothetical protein
MSTGKAMGDWLADTVEAAQYTTQMMEKAREAPKVVIRQMHGYALGLADETAQMLDTIRAKAAAERAIHRTPSDAASSSPPSCNTGGKVPPIVKKHTRKRQS